MGKRFSRILKGFKEVIWPQTYEALFLLGAIGIAVMIAAGSFWVFAPKVVRVHDLNLHGTYTINDSTTGEWNLDCSILPKDRPLTEKNSPLISCNQGLTNVPMKYGDFDSLLILKVEVDGGTKVVEKEEVLNPTIRNESYTMNGDFLINDPDKAGYYKLEVTDNDEEIDEVEDRMEIEVDLEKDDSERFRVYTEEEIQNIRYRQGIALLNSLIFVSLITAVITSYLRLNSKSRGKKLEKFQEKN